jgi:hypothetical protein
MVVIAVVLAFAAFLLLDWYWVRGRRRPASGPRLPLLELPTRSPRVRPI